MFDTTSMTVAFCGGIFGAAFGGLPAFILFGLMALIGTIVQQLTGQTTFLDQIALGPLFGPHVAFTGGVAAVAYAARVGKIDNGRAINHALMGLNAPDVLCIGGVFGLIGFMINDWIMLVPQYGGCLWTNTVAMSVVLTALLIRVCFGRTSPIGRLQPGQSRWKRGTAETGWLSHCAQLCMIGLSVGLPSAVISVQFPKLVCLMFGLCALSLIFLQFGVSIPITHHIALTAAVFAASTGNIWCGMVMGILAVFAEDFFARLFNNHGDTHIDAPSSALAFTFLFLPILSLPIIQRSLTIAMGTN